VRLPGLPKSPTPLAPETSGRSPFLGCGNCSWSAPCGIRSSRRPVRPLSIAIPSTHNLRSGLAQNIVFLVPLPVNGGVPRSKIALAAPIRH
jgi:hypothetical protein